MNQMIPIFGHVSTTQKSPFYLPLIDRMFLAERLQTEVIGKLKCYFFQEEVMEWFGWRGGPWKEGSYMGFGWLLCVFPPIQKEHCCLSETKKKNKQLRTNAWHSFLFCIYFPCLFFIREYWHFNKLVSSILRIPKKTNQ